MWSVGGLTCYHTYLITKNLTTHEQIRAPTSRRYSRNPFAYKNMFINCLWVLCRPLTRSSVSRRSRVDEETLTLGGEGNNAAERGNADSNRMTINGYSSEQQQSSQKIQDTQVKVRQETIVTVNDNNGKSNETNRNNITERKGVIIDSPSSSSSLSSSTTLSKV